MRSNVALAAFPLVATAAGLRAATTITLTRESSAGQPRGDGVCCKPGYVICGPGCIPPENVCCGKGESCRPDEYCVISPDNYVGCCDNGKMCDSGDDALRTTYPAGTTITGPPRQIILQHIPVHKRKRLRLVWSLLHRQTHLRRPKGTPDRTNCNGFNL